MAEPPRKKARLSTSPPPPQLSSSTTAVTATTKDAKMDQEKGFQPEREAECGITSFVNETNTGFTGVLKQRYTDFLVNEITPDGEIVRLTDDRVPKVKNVAQEPSTAETVPEPAVRVTEVVTEVAPPANEPTKVEETIEAVAKEVPSKSDEIPAFSITPEDDAALIEYFGEDLKNEILLLHQKILAKPTAKAATFPSLLSQSITDRVLRGRIHGDVRRIFASKLETMVVDQSFIKIGAAPPVKPHPEGRAPNDSFAQRPKQNRSNQPKGKLGWQELGGEYLHFSLYKENKDTMEVISFMSRMLNMKPKSFAFAGTKDRRAVTVQRVSVYRQYANDVRRINNTLRNARIGGFKYEKHQLELGELKGNYFTITLRDCHFGDDSDLDDAARIVVGDKVIGEAVKHLQAHGFLNYYGLQRFGTFGIGTDEVGKRILLEDFKGAVDAILTISDETLATALESQEERQEGLTKIGKDDLERTLGIHQFRTTGKSHSAFQMIPKRFSAERSIIGHLGSAAGQKSSDYLGALNTITRNLKLMYVHAYQSLVWNVVASERWARYGNKVIKGDLVIVDSQASKVAGQQEEVDESGEVVVLPAADDYAITHDDVYERARPLSEDEAVSGKYSIFDIVLPTPGYDIEYPDNDIGDFYKEFMGSTRGGGLDPGNMRRSQKDFSLAGSYRKLIGQVNDLTYDLKNYRQENEQLVETDLETLNKSRPARPQNDQNRNFQDSTRGGRGGRGGRGDRGDRGSRGSRGGRGRFSDRGGRQNDSDENRNHAGHSRREDNEKGSDDRRSMYRDIRLLDAEQGLEKVEPQNHTLNAMNAWQNLPEKLAVEDRAALEALLAQPAKTDDTKQPTFKETYIQTSADNEGRRTGHRVTALVGNDEGRAISSFDGVDERDEEGGVMLNLSPQSSPKKRSAAEISTFDEPAQEAAPKESGLDPVEPTGADDSNKPEEHAEILEPEEPVKLAVILKFALGTSQYATMALRELMKSGGVKTYKPDFSAGR